MTAAWQPRSNLIRLCARYAQGLKDPEAKRKAIGAGFIRVFQEYADGFQADHGFTPKYLVQARAMCPPCACNVLQITLPVSHAEVVFYDAHPDVGNF